MAGRVIRKAILGALLAGAPVAGIAQWAPGSEITGQSVQVETNGVTTPSSSIPVESPESRPPTAMSCPAAGPRPTVSSA